MLNILKMIEGEKINENFSKEWLSESTKKITSEASKECKNLKGSIESPFKIQKEFENLQKYIYNKAPEKSFNIFTMTKKGIIVYKNKAGKDCIIGVTKRYVSRGLRIITISIKDGNRDFNLSLDTRSIAAGFWLTDDSGNKMGNKIEDKKVEEYLGYIHQKVEEYKKSLNTEKQ